MMASGRGYFVKRIVGGQVGTAFDTMQGDICRAVWRRLSNPSESAHAIQAMGRGKHLDVEPLSGFDHDFPHVGHDGVMKPGVNLVDEEESVSGRDQVKSKSKDALQPIPNASDRKPPII